MGSDAAFPTPAAAPSPEPSSPSQGPKRLGRRAAQPSAGAISRTPERSADRAAIPSGSGGCTDCDMPPPVTSG